MLVRAPPCLWNTATRYVDLRPLLSSGELTRPGGRFVFNENDELIAVAWTVPTPEHECAEPPPFLPGQILYTNDPSLIAFLLRLRMTSALLPNRSASHSNLLSV